MSDDVWRSPGEDWQGLAPCLLLEVNVMLKAFNFINVQQATDRGPAPPLETRLRGDLNSFLIGTGAVGH